MTTSKRPNDVQGTRFSHVVVNVSDLDRSAAFYEMATSLRRAERAGAPDQSFVSLGIRRGRYDGWVLRDPTSASGPAVHLVQWRSPEPVGSAYDAFWHVGFFRICTKSDDVPAVYRDVVAAGGVPFTEPVMPEGQNVTGRPAFSVPDPDGVVLQNVTLAGARRVFHTCLNCTDLAASRTFYETLGLRTYLQDRTEVPVTNHFGTGSELSTYDAALLDCPGVPSPDDMPVFSLDLCRWTLPVPTGSPYEVQHHRGIVRLGLAVADVEAARTALVNRGAKVSEPEQRDFGPEVGSRTAVTAHDPDGAVIELVDRPL
jgi:catechol 2,3-dioxygenase-like lactoylglutathione lyase family enzyme